MRCVEKVGGKEREREGGTAIVTPPVCDGRISGAGGIVFSPLCGFQPPGYGEASGYLYTLPVQHKAAQHCSADHKIIPTLSVCV